MDIKGLYDLFKLHKNISIDTRRMSKNAIFFAIRGKNNDGNIFAQKAIENGAILAVVDNKNYENKNNNIFYVKNSLHFLQNLAIEHRKNLSIPIIAVTGTNGKTTSKELIHEVLSKKYRTFKTDGNLNNHLGVPISILSIKDTDEIAIIEMGASKRGDIKELCNIAIPNYGYITNFGKAHLMEYKTVENIIKTKLELYTFIKKNRGLLFINNDDDIQVKKSKNINSFSFGIKDTNNIVCKLESSSPFLELKINGHRIKTSMIGDYNFYNMVSAFAIGKYFDINENDIIDSISNYKPSNNRTQIVEKNGNFIVMDCYNANPSSMKSAINNFDKNIISNKKILILGDMLELGEASKKEHLELIQYIKSTEFYKTILIGDEFYNYSKLESNNINFYKSSDDFKLNFERETDSHILIKGSRGLSLEKILDFL